LNLLIIIIYINNNMVSYRNRLGISPAFFKWDLGQVSIAEKICLLVFVLCWWSTVVDPLFFCGASSCCLGMFSSSWCYRRWERFIEVEDDVYLLASLMW